MPVSIETGEEIKCEGQVDPDTIVIEGRAFNLTAMSPDGQKEISKFVAAAVADGQIESFGAFKRDTSGFDPLAKWVAFEYELEDEDTSESAN